MDELHLIVKKFEKMLQTNGVCFFDSIDFEDIISHYLEQGSINKARTAIQLGLQQHPMNTEILLLKCELLLLEDKTDVALEILNSLKESQKHPEIHIQLATILSKKGKHYKAIIELEKATNLIFEKDIDILSQLGKEYLFVEDFMAAKIQFKQCLDIDGCDISSLHNLLFCYDQLGQQQEAISFLEEYIDQYPYNDIAWHQMGLIYMQLQFPEKALDCFEYAIISNETFTAAYYSKNKTLELLGRYEEAIESYIRLAAFESTSASIFLHIGICYRYLGNHDLALEYLNQAEELDGFIDYLFYEKAVINKNCGQYMDSILNIKRAIDLNPEERRYLDFIAQLSSSALSEQERQMLMEIDHFLIQNMNRLRGILISIELTIDTSGVDEALRLIDEAEAEIQEYHMPMQDKIHYYRAIALMYQSDERNALLELEKALAINHEGHLYFERKYPEIYKKKSVLSLVIKHGLRGQ